MRTPLIGFRRRRALRRIARLLVEIDAPSHEGRRPAGPRHRLTLGAR